MFQLRIALLVFISAFILCGQPVKTNGAEITIHSCTQEALETAIDSARDSDSVHFSCSGVIEIANPIEITRSIQINGGNAVVLRGKLIRTVFYIAPKAAVIIQNLTVKDALGDSSGGGAIDNHGL